MRKLIVHEVKSGRVVCRPRAERPIPVASGDEEEFRIAMVRYKERSERQFPTWSEVLEILRSIGYAKRIWKPVEAWSSYPARDSGEGFDGSPASGLSCWYARVETPVGPA